MESLLHRLRILRRERKEVIEVNEAFPRLTGNNAEDIPNIYDYLYKLERELKHELEKQDKRIKELEDRINVKA